MLTNVDVFGVPTIPQLSLPIAGAEAEPIQIKNIDGLDPVKAAVSTSPYGVVPGEAITGASVGKRNVVLTLGLNPDWETQTIEELRKLLYRYFMPTWSVTVRFTSTHLPTCQIAGVVESMESNMFSKDPEIQVSIICPRPEFIALVETTVTGTVGDGNDFTEIEYVGSANTGVRVLITPTAARAAYTGPITILVQSIIDQQLVLGEITIDDTHDLEMNSVPGSKYVRVPGDIPTNLLGKVQDGYIWPVLVPGVNLFGVNAVLAGQAWELSYFAKFGGL